MTTRTTTFPITNYDTNHENIDTNHDDNHDNNIDDSRDYTAMTTTMTTMTQKLRYKRPQRHRESRHNFRPRPLDTQSFITKRFITKRYSLTNYTISLNSFDKAKSWDGDVLRTHMICRAAQIRSSSPFWRRWESITFFHWQDRTTACACVATATLPSMGTDWVAQPVDQRCCINGNLIT